jgi:hypothetical protein
VVITVGNAPPLGACASDAPSGLRASVSGHDVTLMWNAPGGTVSSYVLEAGFVSGALDALAATDVGPTPSLFAANVGRGRYYVRARARSACGVTGASNEIVVEVQ